MLFRSVKWLTAREQHTLLNYLGGVADDADDSAEDARDPAEDAEDAAWHDGLTAGERFNLSCWLTLLRTDVFGAMQASIVGKLRKRTDPDTAIGQAIEVRDTTDYAAAARAYTDLRGQLHVECLAALAVLMEAGLAEAAILLRGLGGEAVLAEIAGAARRRPRKDDDEDDDEDSLDEDNDRRAAADGLLKTIAPRLKAAIADPSTVADDNGRKLLMDAVAARRKVSRAGFRREDRADPQMATALRAGAGVVLDVIGELDRLIGVLSAKAAGADFTGDTARFVAAFRAIYLGAE